MKIKNMAVDLNINFFSDNNIKVHLSKFPDNNYYSLWFAEQDDNVLYEAKLDKRDLFQLAELANKFAELNIELENKA